MRKKRWDLSVTKLCQQSVGELFDPLRSLPVEQRHKPKEEEKEKELQMTTVGLKQDNPSRQEDTEGHASGCPNVKQTHL